MKQKHSWMKFAAAGFTAAFLMSNCVTSYDHQGRPVQTVDPAAAAIGAVAIGAIAYSAGKDDRHHHRRHYHRHHRYRGCR